MLWINRSTDYWCLKEILKRLACGNVTQRRNAADVISELIHISVKSTKVVSGPFWYLNVFTTLCFSILFFPHSVTCAAVMIFVEKRFLFQARYRKPIVRVSWR